MDDRQKILAFVAIVKDEAKAIRATLDSVRSFVDRWAICDTGSSDGTQAIVREAMASVDGFLFEETFVGYAESRNRVVDACVEEATKKDVSLDFLLMLSADETLHGGDNLRAFLATYEGPDEVFLIEVRTPVNALDQPRLVRAGASWRYVGEGVHEELRCVTDPERVPKVKVEGC